jgi:hypothetical protein
MTALPVGPGTGDRRNSSIFYVISITYADQYLVLDLQGLSQEAVQPTLAARLDAPGRRNATRRDAQFREQFEP